MSTKNFYTTVVVVVIVILITFTGVCLINKVVDKVEEPTKSELEPVIESIDQNLVVRDVFVPNTNKWMYRISKVKFEGHTYIVLEDTGSCILHDPDCQCQTQK